MEIDKRLLDIEDMPIKYFKMMNGDSIVSYVHDIDLENSLIALEEPMVVTIDEDSHYQFSPWFPFSKRNIHLIDVYNIMTEDDVDNDIKSTYIKAISYKVCYNTVLTTDTRH